MGGLFSGDGRIGRLEYFWVILGLSIVGGIASASAEISPSRFTAFLALASIIVGVWIGFAAQIKRCHDLGRSGWLSLLTLIPLINVGFQIYLLFFPGENDINKVIPSGSEGNAERIVPEVSQYTQAVQTPIVPNTTPVAVAPSQDEMLSDDVLYEQIGVELESNDVDKAVWTRAFAMAGGDDQKTRVNYINLRFGKLKELRLKEQKISFEYAKLPNELVKTQSNANDLNEAVSEFRGTPDSSTTRSAVEQKATRNLSAEDQRYEAEYALARQRIYAKIVLLVISLIFTLILISAGVPELIAALFPMAAFLYIVFG